MTTSFWKKISLALCAVLLFAACQDGAKSGTSAAIQEREDDFSMPRFERDSAFAFVEKQVSFGPRVTNSEGHQAAKAWLVQKLESYGAKVIQQDFQAEAYTGETLNGTNIIARFNPESNKKILLGAHWDTRHVADSPLSDERQDEPILGADDGGSGVAVLLEVARQLHENPIDMGVDIILFDAEDYGEPRDFEIEEQGKTYYCLGSQHWAENPHATDHEYGILLDMVGAKNARFAKEQYSNRIAPNLINKIWQLAQDMGYSNYFTSTVGAPVTDDHIFVNQAGVPMIDIINQRPDGETQFADYWHTHEDDMDIIDSRTLRAVGQVVLAVIYREASGTF